MENKTPHIQILHLEDNPLDAELILHELGKRKLFFNLKRVETRADFVSAIENFKPHIILGDYALPQFDGLSALALTLKNTPNIPFIFVSGFIGEEKAIEILKLGATDYVLKDHLARLVPTISRALEEANQHQKRKEAEKNLEQRTIELQRSNTELEQFAYVASHDLNEPLYIIRAFIDNIKQQPSAKLLDPKIGHALDRIEHGAQRLELLIKDLLEFARINMRVKPFEPVNLGTLADEIIFELGLLLKEAGGTVRLGKLPTVWADKMQMQQLFQNMILNALKFRKKEIPLQIDIASRELDEKWVEISIRDNGIGFEQEYAEKIFLPFQRLHSRSEYEGSGIGLALCHKIVSRHNGTISALGKPGEGTTFTLTLQKERPGVSP